MIFDYYVVDDAVEASSSKLIVNAQAFSSDVQLQFSVPELVAPS